MLKIEITVDSSPQWGEGSSVTIRNLNKAPDCDDAEYTAWNKRWTSVCQGIHLLLSELGPIPDGGWKVEYSEC